MTRDQEITYAKRLRESGATYRAIADKLGYSYQTIYCWLNPEWAKERARRDNAKRGPVKRDWEAGECPQCGGRVAQAARGGFCRPCRDKENEREFKARARRFIKLREEGLLNSEIEQREGIDPGSNIVAVVLCRAKRDYGMDVPRSPYFKAAS